MNRKILTATAFTSSLTACAVLNIDVDVYKGPLANHQDVQLQQMAVMAIGAKPLLVKLCGQLTVVTDRSVSSRKDSSSTDTCRGSKDSLARELEAILSLYDDLLPRELTDKIHELHTQLPMYKHLYNRVFPKPDTKINEQAWDELHKGMWQTFTDIHPAVKEAGKNEAKAVAALEYLKSAYKKFLVGEKDKEGKENNHEYGIRDQDLLICAQAHLYPLYTDKSVKEKWLGKFNPKDTDSTGLEKEYEVTKVDGKDYRLKCIIINTPYSMREKNRKKLDPTSATAEFKGLLKNDAEIVRKHANLLFTDDADPRKQQFIEEVKGIAQDFLDVREVGEKMLTGNLELISFAHRYKGYLPDDTRKKIIEAAAALSVELIRPRYLWYALENTGVPDEDKVIIKELRDKFEEELKDNYRDLYAPQNIQTKYIPLFIRLLKEHETVAKTVLAAHRDLIDKFSPPLQDRLAAIRFTEFDFPEHWEEYVEDNAKWEHPTGNQRRYGISRGQPPPQIEQLEHGLDNLTQVSGLLNRGRLIEGLETLTERYLHSMSSPSIYPAHKDKQRRMGGDEHRQLEQDLHNVLIQFAQKVLFLGNYSVLVENSKRDSLVRKLWGGLGDIFSLTPYSSEDAVPDRYFSMLQAIGNSILIQADELHSRQEHEDRLAFRAESEQWALREALTRPASQVIADLIKGLEAEGAQMSKEITSLGERRTRAETDKQSAEALLALKTNAHTSASNEFTRLKNEKDAKDARLKEIETVIQALNSENNLLKTAISIASPNFSNDLRKITTWSDDQFKNYPTSDQTLERAKRLKVLNDYLTNSGKVLESKTKAYTDTATFLSEVSAAVQRHKAEVSDSLAKLDQVFKIQHDVLTSAEKEKTNAAAKLNELSATLESLNPIKARLEADRSIREEAVKKVTSLSADVLARTVDSPNSGISAIALLTDAVRKGQKDSQGNRTTDADMLEEVVKLIKDKSPKGDEAMADRLAKIGNVCKSSDGNKPGCKTSKEVFDDLIGLLRHEYVQEVKANGEKGERTAKFQSALKAAWDLRSSMVFIRPSGSYLRSSYPSTNLQDDPALTSENLLVEKTLASLPLDVPGRWVCQFFLPKSSESICKDEDREKNKIQGTIDKQFWQSINKVRVTGGGFTNYVVAKDDIGNWSVKEVATDPKDIIKATKKLALFGLGSTGRPALLGSIVKQEDTAMDTAAKAPSNTPLQQIHAKYRATYDTSTSAAVESLKKALGQDGIRATIQSSWESNPSLKDRLGDLKTALENANKQLDDVVKLLRQDTSSETDLAERPSRVLTALQATRRFHHDLQSSIKFMNLTAAENTALSEAKQELAKKQSAHESIKQRSGVAQPDIDSARELYDQQVKVVESAQNSLNLKIAAEKSASEAARDACFETLSKHLLGRKDANKQYETSIMFIGDVLIAESSK